MGDYTYSPIDSAGGEIRLLKLKTVYPINPATQTRPSASSLPLEGSLEHHYLPISSLNQAQRSFRSIKLPLFTALSYVWGDPTRSHEIVIDGQRLPITRSLHAALRGAQIDDSLTTRIWVDAICINQDDLQERSAQVLLMREVYHSASCVRVCLAQELTEEHFKCLRFIEILHGGSSLGDWSTMQQKMTGPSPEPIEQGSFASFLEMVAPTVVEAVIMPFAIIDKISSGIQNVVQNPAVNDSSGTSFDLDIYSLINWTPTTDNLKRARAYSPFSEIAPLIDRLLIKELQELACATKPFVQLGSATIWWDQLTQAAGYLHFTCGLPLPNIDKLLILEAVRVAWIGKKRQSLATLLRACKDKEATDPRDHIFGLLGLVADPLNDSLKPDYQKPVVDVHGDAIRHIIMQKKSLDIICGWQTIGRNENVPSWIPDYSLNHETAPYPLVSLGDRESIYSACSPEFRLNLLDIRQSYGKYLRTRGVLLDSITQISQLPEDDESFEQREKLWSNLLLQQDKGRKETLAELSSILNYYFSVAKTEPVSSKKPLLLEPAGSRFIDPYLHTLTSGEISFSRSLERKLKNPGKFSRKAVQRILNFPFVESEMERLGNAPRSGFESHIQQALDNGTRRRRLAVTETGYLAALPQNSKEGDIVCVLRGCSVPVVLRKRVEDCKKNKSSDNDEYNFVGECYMYGFMDGEAYGMNDGKRREEMVFDLC